MITEEQKQQLDAMFKFKIGNVVKRRFTSPSSHRELREIVIERLLQQCPGGVQLHYLCRGFTRDGGHTETLRLNEIEIEASEPFAEAEWSTAFDEVKRAMLKAGYKATEKKPEAE